MAKRNNDKDEVTPITDEGGRQSRSTTKESASEQRPRETSQERADRRREELKKELNLAKIRVTLYPEQRTKLQESPANTQKRISIFNNKTSRPQVISLISNGTNRIKIFTF